MMFHKSFFGITPEALDTVDINPSFGKPDGRCRMGLVINGKMTIAAKHKSFEYAKIAVSRAATFTSKPATTDAR